MTADTLELTGLEGTNPLGFLAAMGALVVTEESGAETALGWRNAVLPSPFLHGLSVIDELIPTILADRDRVLASTALNFQLKDRMLRDVKFDRPADTRAYLQACSDADDGGLSERIAAALVAQVSLDRQGKAKPTDLHFTAGRQQFLDMARELGGKVDADDLMEALLGPWQYASAAPSFMWDSADDRVYALGATNPAASQKTTVPGADWLALRGLTVLPVVGVRGRTLTPGAAGTWKSGRFSWPLWTPHLRVRTLRALMAQIPSSPDEWKPPAGIFRVFSSGVTRASQGGYGTIRPPRIVWEQHR